MSKVNTITVKLGPRPVDLYIVPKNYDGNRKYIREMSDAQIILSFILIALYMPRGFSQRAQLQWLRDYVATWSGIPNNLMIQRLDQLSKTSLERYMHVAHDAELIYVREDGTEEAASMVPNFGTFLSLNIEDAKKAFPPLALYEGEANAAWVAEALGQTLAPRPPVISGTVTVGEGAPRSTYVPVSNTGVVTPENTNTCYVGGSGYGGSVSLGTVDPKGDDLQLTQAVTPRKKSWLSRYFGWLLNR